MGLGNPLTASSGNVAAGYPAVPPVPPLCVISPYKLAVDVIFWYLELINCPLTWLDWNGKSINWSYWLILSADKLLGPKGTAS